MLLRSRIELCLRMFCCSFVFLSFGVLKKFRGQPLIGENDVFSAFQKRGTVAVPFMFVIAFAADVLFFIGRGKI